LILVITSMTVNSQNSTLVQNKQDDTQKSVVISQQEGQKQNNVNELVPKLKGPDDMATRKDIEVKNQSPNENQKSFFDLKSNERIMIGLLVLVLCFFIFGLVRYFLTGKQ
jgi:hypothetical protein